MRSSALWLTIVGLTLVPAVAWAAPLLIDGSKSTNTCPGGTPRDGGNGCEYGGTQTFDYVELKNGATLYVKRYDGVNAVTSGNLVLKASGRDPTNTFSIRVDATSRIVAKGLGYQAMFCDNGAGPAIAPLSGGRGGCSVLDGGGGGGHSGAGGRGTKDNPPSFPAGYEEACGSLMNGGVCSATTANCYNNDALPTVAGQSFFHSIYANQFGAAGGDRGCRDGGATGGPRGGNGGGRLVLFAANAAQTGVLQLDGRVTADGNRGCAAETDSAGGGAGGTVFFVADTLTVGATARISAHGGAGGTVAPKCLPCADDSQCESGQKCQAVTDPQSGRVQRRCGPCNCTPCTSNAQCNALLGETCKSIGGAVGTVCANASNQCTPFDPGDDEGECTGTQNSGGGEDCGGGGGGGVVEFQSRVATIAPQAIIDARGGAGGVTPVCTGEAGAPSRDVRVNLGYRGEVCDGADNDFNGSVDDGLPELTCAGGVKIPSCVGGLPQTCPVDAAACQVATPEALPRFAVLLGTSGSMLGDIAGNPLFGDGSQDYPGVSTGAPSRLFIAKSGLMSALAAMPKADFALARFHQDASVARSCLTVSNAECASQGYSYDDPTDNVAPVYPSSYPGNQCVLRSLYPTANYPAPSAFSSNVSIGQANQLDCINYAGSCGAPRRGAQVLVGFDKPASQLQSWIDGKETNFREMAADVDGAHCVNGDCELRATGDRPLAGGLQALRDWLKPIVACDANKACRDHSVILIADGDDSCGGAAAQAAADLLSLGIKTWVIGLSVASTDRAALNAIAQAGGTNAGQFTGGTDRAFFGGSPAVLAEHLATIVAVKPAAVETCNDLDDDCDGLIDEGFADKGVACDNGKLGACRVTGATICAADGSGTVCSVAMEPGPAPVAETCNGIDDDCNGVIDDADDCAPVDVPDAGGPDAGQVDAGPADAGPTPDAGAPDAGRDAGFVTDAGLAEGEAPVVDEGCACDVVGARRSSPSGLGTGLLAIGLALSRRVRRRDRYDAMR